MPISFAFKIETLHTYVRGGLSIGGIYDGLSISYLLDCLLDVWAFSVDILLNLVTLHDLVRYKIYIWRGRVVPIFNMFTEKLYNLII